MLSAAMSERRTLQWPALLPALGAGNGTVPPILLTGPFRATAAELEPRPSPDRDPGGSLEIVLAIYAELFKFGAS
jgi:hypothetical protein